MKGAERKRNTLGHIEHDILQHLTAGDFLISFLVSGRSTRAFYREAYKRARANYRYKRSVKGLEIRGLVNRRGDTLHLTDKGRQLLEILSAHQQKPGRWGGRWWTIMYDIPVSMSSYRFELRRLLIRSGFHKLQHSVWVHPHPCRELEIFLRNNPLMKKYIRYVETLPFADMETVSDWKKLPTA